MSTTAIFDLETDGLLDEVTQIWCVGSHNGEEGSETLLSIGTEDIKEDIAMMMQADIIVGHNIIGYDLPVIKKLYRYAPKQGAKIVDTLILSRLLCRKRQSHSLEAWGQTFNFPKGDHTDWTRYTSEMGEYCIQDVNITIKLYNYLMEKTQ